mmetsp:Transcript_21494/g.38496  ORF Transcript_21494/g.38496 Transcript_21494/m.38496 type:complete len:197 (+) Transcript_21494:118-708(+)|eukprot:CAMPEP_0201609372 /NCGR_PEP_ID=MMETSP0492-20130828/13309_1 /ASSEMBLY_ACC=CAM_ASM_000837 /TAXON_ID=420259 /ORGANISM="Thalassiosira gravida, Strain GMp14c1" /LENGTH=196 /DNA_ID=CAMNT_0048074787 /DNA_START=57 /DNA_END=647 /DNA_ORIENTATION=+
MSSGRVKLMNMLMRPNRSKLKGYQKQPPPKRWNIVRGDTVQIIDRKHPEFGKQGTVQVVIRDKMRVIVENVNLGPKRIKADPERGVKGETIMQERSIHYSNVNLVDPVTGFPTRVSYSHLEDGTKVRISKRSGAIIPKPDVWKSKMKGSIASEDSDTVKDEDVWAVTYEEKTSKWEDMLAALEEEEKKLVGDKADA